MANRGVERRLTDLEAKAPDRKVHQVRREPWTPAEAHEVALSLVKKRDELREAHERDPHDQATASHFRSINSLLEVLHANGERMMRKKQ